MFWFKFDLLSSFKWFETIYSELTNEDWLLLTLDLGIARSFYIMIT